jgi:hypothetical protein
MTDELAVRAMTDLLYALARRHGNMGDDIRLCETPARALWDLAKSLAGLQRQEHERCDLASALAPGELDKLRESVRETDAMLDRLSARVKRRDA